MSITKIDEKESLITMPKWAWEIVLEDIEPLRKALPWWEYRKNDSVSVIVGSYMLPIIEKYKEVVA